MKPAVFLDRDGTLIDLVHHLADPAAVRLIPGAGASVRRLAEAGFTTVVVTNQSVIGRGLLTEAGLAEIHEVMHRQLAAEGGRVDHVYFCPIAPVIKDPTVIEDPMRKPGPGMLLQAARDHGLDLAASWMVGDTVSDILAGRHAGCRTVLVRTGYGMRDDRATEFADAVVPDVSGAVDVILNHSTRPRVEEERS